MEAVQSSATSASMIFASTYSTIYWQHPISGPGPSSSQHSNPGAQQPPSSPQQESPLSHVETLPQQKLPGGAQES